MGDEEREDRPFVSRIGPLVVDWPRTVGFYGGIALAVAFDLVAPPLAAFVAVVPLLKLLKRKDASKVERAVASVLEGAAKPVGGDAESTVRPAWQEDEKNAERDAREAELTDERRPDGSASTPDARDPRGRAPTTPPR